MPVTHAKLWMKLLKIMKFDQRTRKLYWRILSNRKSIKAIFGEKKVYLLSKLHEKRLEVIKNYKIECLSKLNKETPRRNQIIEEKIDQEKIVSNCYSKKKLSISRVER